MSKKNKKNRKKHTVKPLPPAENKVSQEKEAPLTQVSTAEPQEIIQKKKTNLLSSLICILLCLSLCMNLFLLYLIFDLKNEIAGLTLPVISHIPDESEETTVPEATSSPTKATTPSDPPIDEPHRLESHCLNVKNILQIPGMPNGCEVVSLTIALNYLGYDIDHFTLYSDFMPRSDLEDGDPWTTYVGEATDVGYGCYAPCVVDTGNDYIESVGGEHKVYNVSGKTMKEYEDHLIEGTPVIFWGLVNMNMNPSICWVGNVDGKQVIWHSNSHCLVLIGFNEYNYIFCDPLVGIVEYDKQSVEKSFEINYKQACIIK